MPAKTLSSSRLPIALILVAALGAMTFTIGAGAFLVHNNRSVVRSSELIEHTHEVLSSILLASQSIDRIDASARLYLLTQDADQLETARTNSLRLQTAAVHLKNLVADNGNQSSNVENLEACSNFLVSATGKFHLTQAPPTDELMSCRQTLSLMSEQERRLLRERTDQSTHHTTTSLTTELSFVGLSLAALVILFGLMLRIALERRMLEKQTALVNIEFARNVATLEERALESSLLTHARDELQLCLSLPQVYQSAANSVAALLPGTSGSLCMINNSRQLVETVITWGDLDIPSRTPEMFTPESCCGLRSGQLRWKRTQFSEIDCAHFTTNPPECYLCVPMIAHGDIIGVLYIECPNSRAVALVERRIEGVRQLVQLTGMAVGSLQLRNKLESQSIRDSLTGLFNRHFMQIALDRELARAQRRQSILAVLMLDVDHFKQFNDTYGHGAGDAVLKAVSEIFQNSIRTEDVACRYGGEEFAIILPDVTREAAYERADTIRQRIAAIRSVSGSNVTVQITLSIGVAFYPSDGITADHLLRKADEALYRAKHGGRDQVVFAETATALSRIPNLSA
jgi:diguanylate cyclase (GGDEF)-like protein